MIKQNHEEIEMNCWEFKKCGKEKGGACSIKDGICPAYVKEAGEACWLIAGTLCDGVPAKNFIQKRNHCMQCDFFKSFDQAHRAKMRFKFQCAS